MSSGPTSSSTLALSDLYYTPCAVCGAEFDQACRTKAGNPITFKHKSRYDAKARADLFAWRNLGAHAPG